MNDIYPYVVTKDYPINEASGKSISIGNELYYEYIRDKNGIVESFDISKQNDKSKIQKKAIENLKNAFKNNIKAMSFENGPANSQFILLGNHWTAATQILNPDLYDWAKKILKTEKLIVSIPNRETLLIFPSMDKKYFSDIKTFVKGKESGERKMLTFELYELNSTGFVPLEK